MRMQLLLQSWAGLVKHPVEVLKFGTSRAKVRFLDDNPKGKRGSVRWVPLGALHSADEREQPCCGRSLKDCDCEPKTEGKTR